MLLLRQPHAIDYVYIRLRDIKELYTGPAEGASANLFDNTRGTFVVTYRPPG